MKNKKVSVVFFETLLKVDISEVIVLNIQNKEDYPADQDINEYVEWWLCFEYGCNHGKHYEVYELKQTHEMDVKNYNKDDMY